MAFCRNCGTELSDGAKFCPSCGTPVNKSGTPVNKSGTPVNKNRKRVEYEEDVQEESTELSLWKKIVIGLCLIGCIGFFVEKCGGDLLSGTGSDEFSTLKSCLPKNGVSYCVVKDAKTFGSIGRKLQSIVFYEKDGKRDVIIEGIEKDGSTYQNTGNWKKDIKNATYKAVDYKYFNFSYSVDEFFVDKDLNIYFASALFSPSDSDVGEAFEKGPIGKLQKCSSEEDFKNQLKRMKEDAKNNPSADVDDNRPIIGSKDVEFVKKKIKGTVWTFTDIYNNNNLYWTKLVFNGNVCKVYSALPEDGKWTYKYDSPYYVTEKRLGDGKRYVFVYLKNDKDGETTSPLGINITEGSFIYGALGARGYIRNRDYVWD